MGKIVKSVSLDPETDAIAGMIPNFSRFVRNCLRRYHATIITPICRTDEAHIIGGYCIPSSKRLCLACWPNGPPDYADWKTYNLTMKLPDCDDESFMNARDWIQEKAKEANPGMIDFTDIPMKGNAKPEKKVKAKKGIIARILRL